MKCGVDTYSGSDPFVFMIFCRDDENVVYPLIERLARYGLHVWYDNGEMSDDVSSWKTNVQKMAAGSTAFVAFLSNHAVNSHLFREHFTQALSSKKPVLAILQEDPPLSPAMRKQTERCACFQCAEFPQDDLIQRFLQTSSIRKCRGPENPDIQPQPYKQAAPSVQADAASSAFTPEPSDQTIRELKKSMRRETSPETANPNAESALPDTQPEPQPAENRLFQENGNFEDNGEKTVFSSRKSQIAERDCGEETVTVDVHVPQMLIVSMKTGEYSKIRCGGEVTVGRRAEAGAVLADVTFHESSKLFSRNHFKIIITEDICSVLCTHPNGLSVDGKDVKNNENCRIGETAGILVPENEVLKYANAQRQSSEKKAEPVLLLIARGDAEKKLEREKTVACLIAEATGEARFFTKDSFELGKSNPWSTDAVSAGTISRRHASITWKDGKYWIEDHSTNGTRLNGELLQKGKKELHPEDRITVDGNEEYGIGPSSFIFLCVRLDERV